MSEPSVWMSKVAVLAAGKVIVFALLPNAEGLPMMTVPEVRVGVPVNVFAPESVKVPAVLWVNPKVPANPALIVAELVSLGANEVAVKVPF